MASLGESLSDRREEEVTFTLDGVEHTRTLIEPGIDAVLDQRRLLVEHREDAATLLLRTRASAVRHCLPDDDLTQDQAMLLVARTGGELGELSSKAWKLIGGKNPGAPAKADDANPTK
ncbi:MAG: hypothetical protein OXB91_07390 [Bryobacterales bacterium]|nr:hypothetical protein [Bryobacterales bacterium]